jgi:hypothetical protein
MRRISRRCLASLLASVVGLLSWAAVASAQEVLYGADGAGGSASNLYILDPSSGRVLQTVGPIGFSVTGLALDPMTGTLYGATSRGGDPPGGEPDPGSLITINTTTGAGTLVGDLRPDDEAAADITFTSDGALYGWLEPDTDDLVSIDKTTGAATVVGESGLLDTGGSGIASNAAGVLYLAGLNDTGTLDTIDRATGAATPGPTLSGTDANQIAALAFDAAGNLFGARHAGGRANRTSDLIRIDTSSGRIKSLGPSIDRLDAIAFAPKPSRAVTLQKRLKPRRGKVKLFGQVDAPGNEPACSIAQTVQLLRMRVGGKAKRAVGFRPFRTLTTDQAGNFKTKVRRRKSYRYEAVLPETPVCDSETSNSTKVKARRRNSLH